MKTIVCVDKNWGIGCANDLLYHIPADMKHFKEKTMGNVVVMGLATLVTYLIQNYVLINTWFGEKMDIQWKATSGTEGEATMEGTDKAKLAVDGDKLVMSDDSSSMTFAKKA